MPASRLHRRRTSAARRQLFRHSHFEALEERRLLATWSGTIPNGTVWANTEVQRITGDITIPAGSKLTIQPGTIIKFDNVRSMNVLGAIDALGTAGSPIIITSVHDDTVGGDTNGNGSATTPARGNYGQIYLNPQAASKFQFVNVRYAGNNSAPGNGCCLLPAVRIDDANPADGALLIEDVNISQVDGIGMQISRGAPTISRVSVSDARQAAFQGSLDVSPVLTLLTATNSGINGYEINGGTMSASRTWNFGGLTGMVANNIDIGVDATLTIAAGQIIKFQNARDMEVYGAIQAVGAADNPITFTSYRDDAIGGDTNNDGASTAARGDWRYVYVNGKGASQLRYVEMRFAGNYSSPGSGCCTQPSLWIDDANESDSSLAVSDIAIRNADNVGVYIQRGSPTLTRVSVDSARAGAFRGELNANPTLVQLTATNSGTNGYVIVGGSLITTRIWDFGGIPALLEGEITIDSTGNLTIAAGQIIKSQGFRDIDINGSIQALGTIDKPIIFTSYRDDTAGGDTNNDGASAGARGDWHEIKFDGKGASQLRFVEIRYAGNYASPGNSCCVRPSLWIDDSNEADSSLAVSDVTIRQADDVGVYIQRGSPTLTRVAVDSARAAAFRGELNANPTLVQLSAVNSAVNGYAIVGGALTTSRTWNFGSLVGWLEGEVTVSTTGMLTIAAGQIIKSTGFRDVDVMGAIQALGTPEKPIIFTSFRDDSAGGDTNNDGPSTGVRGDWDRVYFDGIGASELRNVEIRYGGNDANAGNSCCYSSALWINDNNSADSTLLVNQVQIRDVDREGVFVERGAPQLNAVSVLRARADAFRITLAAGMVAANLSAAQSGSNAVAVDSGNLATMQTWSTGGLPAKLNGDFVVTTSGQLNLEAGQVVKVPQGTRLSVSGKLTALGTASQPIIFTSLLDDTVGGDTNNDGAATLPVEGGWRALEFESGSSASRLEYAKCVMLAINSRPITAAVTRPQCD